MAVAVETKTFENTDRPIFEPMPSNRERYMPILSKLARRYWSDGGAFTDMQMINGELLIIEEAISKYSYFTADDEAFARDLISLRNIQDIHTFRKKVFDMEEK